MSNRGGGGGAGGHRHGGANTSTALWYKMMRYLEAKDLMPVVVFSFSKKRCEECAQALSNLDMNTAREKSQVKGGRSRGSIRSLFLSTSAAHVSAGLGRA